MLLADLYMYNTPIAGLSTGLSRYETLCMKLSAGADCIHCTNKQYSVDQSTAPGRPSDLAGDRCLPSLPFHVSLFASHLSVRRSVDMAVDSALI